MPRPILLVAHGSVHPRQPTGPLFDVILLLHVACALLGLASVVVSAVFATRLRAMATWVAAGNGPSNGGDLSASLRRYYAPGANWMGRVLYAVPVLGVALVAASKGYASFADGWLLGGVALWVAAIFLGEGVVWPGERRLQELCREDPTLAPTGPGTVGATGPLAASQRTTIIAACRRVVAGSLAMGAILVMAFVVMTARP